MVIYTLGLKQDLALKGTDNDYKLHACIMYQNILLYLETVGWLEPAPG